MSCRATLSCVGLFSLSCLQLLSVGLSWIELDETCEFELNVTPKVIVNHCMGEKAPSGTR